MPEKYVQYIIVEVGATILYQPIQYNVIISFNTNL